MLPCASLAPFFSRAVKSGFGKQPRRTVATLQASDGDETAQMAAAPVTKAHPALDALIDQFISPQNGNMTATVEEYLDLCDHALLTYLHGRIEAAGEQTDKVSPTFFAHIVQILRVNGVVAAS